MSKTHAPGLTTLEDRINRIARIIDELKGEAITVLDLRELSDFADAFVIATVRSRTHMQGLAIQLMDQLRDAGIKPVVKPDLNSERWTLVDYGNVIIHLFNAEGRSFYGLEQLWGDAREIDWQIPVMA